MTAEAPTATTAAPASRGRRRVGPALALAPAVAGLAVFLVAPLVVFVGYSFLTGGYYDVTGPLTTDNYRLALESEINRQLAQNSLEIGAAVGATSVLLGLPIAYWLRYCAGRWQTPVLFLFAASMFASYLVRIFAWRTLLGQHGVINSGLESLGVIHDPLAFLLFSKLAVVLALLHIALPYVVLMLFAAFRPLEPIYLEAAQDLGASAWTRWRRVILPLMAAPAAAAFLFIFVLSAGDYVTPQLLGSRTGSLLGVEIQTQFKAVGNFAAGAATSVLMLLGFLLSYGVVAIALRLCGIRRVKWVS